MQQLERAKLIQEIQHLVDTSPSSAFSSISRSKKLEYLKKFILDQTSFLDQHYQAASIKLDWCTRWHYLKNSLHEILRCKTCNKPLVKKIGVNEANVPSYCSIKCAMNDEDVIQKRKKTCLYRHGDSSYNNIEKAFRTRLQRNSGSYDSFVTKLKKSQHCSLRKDEVRIKGEVTRCRLHGDKNFNNRAKAKQTCLKSFGCENPSQSIEVKHVKEATCKMHYGCSSYLQSDECKKKLREKVLSRYGNECFFKSQAFKELVADESFQRKRKLKEHQTKKQNRSFNTSRVEDEAFEMLRFIFPMLRRQHVSDGYPFHCDFYDPAQPNARFEFQGSWTHGKHAFNEQDLEDQLQLMKMLAKGTKYYLNAVQTWIIRDPYKREVAKKNGIQLIEFWSLDEVRDFVIHFFDAE